LKEAAMAKKTTAASSTKGNPEPAAAATQPAPGTRRATIRMYRLGVGDCFLLSFPRAGQDDFRILIDCGVHQAQSEGSQKIKDSVQDLKTILPNGKIDVVVGTHEHQDHLSGFPEIQKVFGAACAGEVWAAWTEDADDPFAKSLRTKKDQALTALYGAHTRMRLAGATEQEGQLGSLLGFFGDEAGPKLKAFGAALKSLSNKITYLQPGDPPIEIVEDQVRVFVLGPPREKELLEQSDPSKKDKDQIYNFGAYMGLLEQVTPALGDAPVGPFDDRFTLPLEGTKALPFFKQRYWAETNDEKLAERSDNTQDWRRIDADWMSVATTLAMQLDQDTNNTSLVLAFELGPKKQGGPVLLFAADAQVGNWLSWQNVTWTFEGRTITGPDLLKRTILYKVGHHASHNATLRKLGLETMANLELALVPTDAEMAAKVKWGTLPWPPLLKALADKATQGVVRTDESYVAKPADDGKPPAIKVRQETLFYEVEL
jgi:Metallo-beta-lactamase superfamily